MIYHQNIKKEIKSVTKNSEAFIASPFEWEKIQNVGKISLCHSLWLASMTVAKGTVHIADVRDFYINT